MNQNTCNKRCKSSSQEQGSPAMLLLHLDYKVYCPNWDTLHKWKRKRHTIKRHDKCARTLPATLPRRGTPLNKCILSQWSLESAELRRQKTFLWAVGCLLVREERRLPQQQLPHGMGWRTCPGKAGLVG